MSVQQYQVLNFKPDSQKRGMDFFSKWEECSRLLFGAVGDFPYMMAASCFCLLLIFCLLVLSLDDLHEVASVDAYLVEFKAIDKALVVLDLKIKGSEDRGCLCD